MTIKRTDTQFLEERITIKNYGAIYLNKNGKFLISPEKVKDESLSLVAECNFNKVINEKGWDKLSIKTYKAVNAYQQAFLAGYLEGRMTAEDIFYFYNNLKVNHMKSQPKTFTKMLDFFTQVAEEFSKKIYKVKKEFNNYDYKEKKYWSRLILGYTQLEGLVKGYTFEVSKNNQQDKLLTMADFLILQADGEVPELLRYFRSKWARKKNVQMGDTNYFNDAFGINTQDPLKFWNQLMWTSKCSAFIKIIQDEQGKWKDLLAGHTTWTEYYEMLRTYKHYKFELDEKGFFYSSELTFSSYPGCLSSTDDFFLTNHNLLVMETTLEVIDIRLYENVKDPKDYIPNFVRVLAATRFAKTASEWSEYFAKDNSGTYSSQWMIIDYKVFEKIKNTPNKKENLVYMMEQTPDRIVYHDISNYIYQHKYFGSFNRAFLEETKNDLHVALVKHLYGPSFGYRGSHRGKIFKHLQEKVSDLKSLKDLLRYNGYKHPGFQSDPSSKNPGEGISARYDLAGFGLTNLSGGIDCKVTNYELVKDLTAVAISGPTNENNPNLTIFEWAQVKQSIKRDGVPEKYNFPYIIMNPNTLCCDNQNDIYSFK